MQLMDPRGDAYHRRRHPSRSRFGSAFLIFLLLSTLSPAVSHAQAPNTQTPNPATPGTPSPGAPSNPQKPDTPITGQQRPATMTPGGTPTTTDLKIETYVERAERKGTALRLSLKDAMRMALQNNLSIAIQDYSEEIFRSRIFGATYVYEPHLVTGINWQSQTTPNISFFNFAAGTVASTGRTLNWSARLLQNLPYGGTYYVDYGSNRFVRLPPTNSDLFASRYSGNLTFSFNQPLWRDFRDNVSFRTLKLAKLDDRINDTQFEEQVTTVIKQVQDLYWELVYAIQFQNIRKKSLDLARVQLDNNKRKVEIGILAPIAITEASAEEALRLQDIISSENQINSMENNLKRAISKDRTSEIWNQDIIPMETPEIKDVRLDMNEAIITALQKRPELRRVQLNTEKNDVDYNFYRNQKKPRIDFNGVVGTIGTAGTLTPRGTELLQSSPGLTNLVGSVGAVNSQIFSAPYRSYIFGVTLDIPLRNRSLQETLAQISLTKRQNLKQLKDQEQMVVVDVRNAIQAIETNRQVVETAKVGYRLAQEQLDAENKRFQAGLSTTFFVLQRQRDLSDAEGRLLRAQVDYQKSLNDLQKAKFTTIDQNDMEIAKTQVPPNER